jgi:hypothetical protein
VRLGHSPDSGAGTAKTRPLSRTSERDGARWVRLGAALVVAVAALLVIAQLVLPGIAAERVREQVGRYGAVREVHVHAVPAIELLWGDADEISVKAGDLRISPRQLVDLERNLAGVTDATLTAPRLNLVLSSVLSGAASFEDVRLTKRGSALRTSGTLRSANLHVALPAAFRVAGLSAASGRPEVAVSGEAFGVHAAGRGVMRARDGKVVVELAGLPFAGLGAATIFSDPRIYVENVTASPRGDGLLIGLGARPTG